MKYVSISRLHSFYKIPDILHPSMPFSLLGSRKGIEEEHNLLGPCMCRHIKVDNSAAVLAQ